eukprot:TRINITY_DN29839_c0_g1_i1.p1 TRINITY_DN29839_c0_g1~~TRINITY_DN29839_c0_g1_i1.p1  ORF type:complete len:174 (+),score=27.64 TRINITY_DN29839_c0_g1_i1:145-666(+)
MSTALPSPHSTGFGGSQPGGRGGGLSSTSPRKRDGKADGRKQPYVPKEPHRLRFPEFEWYLGPMYQRFKEIQVEKMLASRVVEVKKKAPSDVTSILPHERHTKPRPISYSFGDTCRGHNPEGIRDCGSTLYSHDMGLLQQPAVRKNKLSLPRRSSCTPAAGDYDLPRWPLSAR